MWKSRQRSQYATYGSMLLCKRRYGRKAFTALCEAFVRCKVPTWAPHIIFEGYTVQKSVTRVVRCEEMNLTCGIHEKHLGRRKKREGKIFVGKRVPEQATHMLQ